MTITTSADTPNTCHRSALALFFCLFISTTQNVQAVKSSGIADMASEGGVAGVAEGICQPGPDGMCADTSEANDTVMPCKDDHNSCASWAERGECANNPSFMLKSCRRSCLLCDDEIEACVDNNDKCQPWADAGECEANPNYMLTSCRKSCHICVDKDAPIDLGVKQETKGTLVEETLEIIRRTKEYVENEVMVKPEYRSVRAECKNRNKSCAFWAAKGECELNPAFMTLQCAPSCKTCDKIDINNRCPVDPNAVDAFGPGDLNKLFERLTTEEKYSGYIPKVHSRPYHPRGGMGDLGADYQLGPWVVTFENFLSPEECQALIELGAKEGYQRSQDVGEKKFDGTYDSYKSEQRTSENSWCKDACYEDPIAQRVIRRIENVTGVPETNSEYLQLLRYEVGQFYRQHHDYIPHQKERLAGVRQLTLFLYLNDVEEGGGTNFPLLNNLTIFPKTGRALFWPSVLDSDPNEKDGRTEHQALPVEKGVKYGCNAWLHQRDFKTAFKTNCN